jgi:hypothetical protein
MNDDGYTVASVHEVGVYGIAFVALVMSIVTTQQVCEWQTRRHGLNARYWTGWLAFIVSLPAYLAILTLFIR